MSKKRTLVTAALPYANGPLHIGHIAGGYLPADIFVRYKRQKGEEVVFICGSDEHGAAITIRAMMEGVTPQEIVDRYHAINKQAFEDFGIDFNIYHRTSDPLHHKTSQEFFLGLDKQDAFTKKTSEQYFDEEKQQFLADRYIMGECPKCGHPDAYGDQCENCGSALSPRDLINPRSKLSGSKPVLKETTHWFLPMDQHEDWLRTWLKSGELDGQPHHDPSNWKKNVLGQCMSWIEGGLQARAMTRDLDWGVPVPLPGAEGKVMYVWLDAPIGYISATKQWAADNGKNWEDYWKSEDTELIHFLGKDNIVFHCIIFPILLRAHGEFVLPTNVPANEFLNLEGDKISTSRNHAVWLHEYLEELPGRKDELRYVLASILPENKDSEFTWKDYQDRVNNELVAILGNFVNRALVLTTKYFDGVVPERNEAELTSAMELVTTKQFEIIGEKVSKAIEQYRFKEALTEAMNMARLGNKFLADTEPWKLYKQGAIDEVKTILNFSIQVVANLSIILKPFLPEACSRLEEMLNLEPLAYDQLGNLEILKPGHQLNKPTLLFQKVEDGLIEAQVAKLLVKEEKAEETQEEDAAALPPQKDVISFDDFTKLDIRVGTILEAEKVKKADKLLKLLVDTGIDQRTIVSGIAQHYSPEEVIGKRVSVLLNLAPRKIRGVESQGMILMAENAAGELAFVSPEKVMGSGSEIR